MELNKIYNIDCVEGMSKLPENSVDLAILDIPYNVTNNDWDKFSGELQYLDFLSKTFQQCSRLIKNTGSIYLFHNDFLQMCQIQQMIQNETPFVFKQLIVWNKKFDGSFYEWRKNSTLRKEHTKNFPKYAEYILYYTLGDVSPSDQIHRTKENFSKYKNYISGLLQDKNLTYNSDKIKKALFERMGYKSMQSTTSISSRLFNPNYKAFGIMTEKQYEVIKDIIGIGISYADLFKMYQEGLDEAKTKEIDRYTFNNLGTHHSVWNYNNVPASKRIHPTEKPEDLITNMLLYSSNEGDIVLDPFMGSGITAECCIKTKRNYIGFEKNKIYFDLSDKRILEYTGQ